MPQLRAAKSWSQRPTAVLMNDPWYGHRDLTTGMPYGDRDGWLEWDYALVSAYQTIEDFTDNNGLLKWEMDDDAVFVDAKRQIDKFEEAKQQTTGGTKYKARDGEYFIPDVKTRRSDGHFQTFTEWVEASQSGKMEEE
jgi:hypothetical protein